MFQFFIACQHQELASKTHTSAPVAKEEKTRPLEKNPTVIARDLPLFSTRTVINLTMSSLQILVAARESPIYQSSLLDLTALKTHKMINVIKEITQHCLLVELKVSMCQVQKPPSPTLAVGKYLLVVVVLAAAAAMMMMIGNHR